MKPAGLPCAFALLLLAPSAAAQVCSVSQVGQACNQGFEGICALATCTSGPGPVVEPVTMAPCGICEPLACPVAMAGQPCDAGTCTAATCVGTDDAGSSTTQSCAVCLPAPHNACPADHAGMACADGGVCTDVEGVVLGPAGTSPPLQVRYPLLVCAEIVGIGDAAGDDLQDGDAGETAPGDGGGDAGSASPASHSSGASGCGISAVPTPGRSAFWLLAGSLALVSLRRIRRRG